MKHLIKQLITTAGKLEDIIFNNEKLFLDMYSKGKWSELIGVSFHHSGIEFIYLLYEGATVSDGISWTEFEKFIEVVDEN